MHSTRIIGAGFAGLSLATSLKKVKADLILIDKSNHHLFQPLLYQVATAALSPARITYPIREAFRKQPNTTVIMGEVSSLDKNQKKVFLANGETVGYDFLIVATGARHSYFGENSWESFAPGLKTIQDAITIREKILTSFEIAERLNEPEEINSYLHFVIIGGGPTGVEMAGAIVEISKMSLKENYRKIKPEKAKVFLIEALPHILPSYSKKLSQKAKKDLESLGVTVLTGKKVTAITEDGVYMEDTFLKSKNIIWAAGNQASPLLATLDAPLDRQGRLLVESDLSVPGYPEIFVIGDAAHIKGEGIPLPATASVAIQQGKYVAKLLSKGQFSLNRPPFLYKDKGSMATIGKGKAIAKMGKLEFSGLLAWLSWGLIHIIYLVGFRNRIRVLFEWLTLFITGQRVVRLIIGNIDEDLPKK
ncbi:MAG: NAD(P)/FAD-dependent oxidoreductase [Chlamydiota bacterium]